VKLKLIKRINWRKLLVMSIAMTGWIGMIYYMVRFGLWLPAILESGEYPIFLVFGIAGTMGAVVLSGTYGFDFNPLWENSKEDPQ